MKVLGIEVVRGWGHPLNLVIGITRLGVRYDALWHFRRWYWPERNRGMYIKQGRIRWAFVAGPLTLTVWRIRGPLCD